MGFLPLADGAACFIGGIHQLTSKLVGHAAAIAGSREIHQPTQGHGRTALLAHFHRHLIGGTTDPSGAHFHQRCGVADGGLEELYGVGPCPFVDQAEGVREDSLCR